MHLYAFDKNSLPVNVSWALEGRNYFCPECGEKVRVRGGGKVQRHFFHLRNSVFCRQEGKGIVHLMVQKSILARLPDAEAKMEMRFPQIKRVADVAWEAKKIVFEVQCANMHPDEALARTADYQSVGWEVIWILHDQRYNQIAVSPMEKALLHIPHYFTDINESGEGDIYDQISLWQEDRRLAALPERPVVLNLKALLQKEGAPNLLKARHERWKIFLEDDYLDYWEKDSAAPFWQEILKQEAKEKRTGIWKRFHFIADKLFFRPYRISIQMLLESCCR